MCAVGILVRSVFRFKYSTIHLAAYVMTIKV